MILSAVGLGVILSKLDPTTKLANIVLFYTDLFALIFSLTFLVGVSVRYKFGSREHLPRHMLLSARQSAWFGLLILASFILLSFQLFTWWNTLLLVFSLIFLESYFLFK